MYILASNIWFTKLMKQFFFWIDKIVFNFISIIYDVMISIARTSVFTQSDISQMADRIYKLLAIFMVFKVTLSLITYVVNPDDFSDKSKGVSKLGINIVISMALLILTPYIFNYAYQLQTIILEDNSLGVLIFGGNEANESFFNTAGDKIAYTTMTPFFTPNTSIDELVECTTLTVDGKFNPDCNDGLTALTKDGSKENPNFTTQTKDNYIAGVENGVLGLMFRQDMAVATYETEDDETEFVMEYKFIFSTITGVIIILLLITFCMDIAVRSIKLAFLQLVAPIPIISYVDPKSGKDGLFKKWYEMCIKTFLSLFIRLIALYFAVFIISKVADLKLVDVVDGSYVRNGIISIFIIIGALMFAKQLPKMLEGLGIKLDGDGKFFLNPFKKFEEQAIGGKRLTGAAGGAVAGAIGGRGIGAIGGAIRGFAGNKGYAGGLSSQAEVNRKIRDARINGAGFWRSRAAVFSEKYGLENADLEPRAKRLENKKEALRKTDEFVSHQVKEFQRTKSAKEAEIAELRRNINKKTAVSSSGKKLAEATENVIVKQKANSILGKVLSEDGKEIKTMGVSDIYGALAEGSKFQAGAKIEGNDPFEYMYFDTKERKVKSATFEPGHVITQEEAHTLSNSATAYLKQSEDTQRVFESLMSNENGSIVNSDFEIAKTQYEKDCDSAGEKARSGYSDVKAHTDEIDQSEEIQKAQKKINNVEQDIEKIDIAIKEAEENAKVYYEGKPINYKEFKDEVEEESKELERIKKVRQASQDRIKIEKINNGSGK